MKLVSVGIDPDHIRYSADHVSAELFDLEWLSLTHTTKKLTNNL